MSKHVFERRAQAFENEFFHRADQQLVAKLQEQHRLECDEDALAIASGIVDRETLDELLAINITPKTLAAFALFPAVHVAWANGPVQRPEREAVLRAAHDQGISDESPAHQLLDSWLKRKPSAELFSAWKDFIHAIRPTISLAAFQELRDAAMKRAHDIAEAAGGLMNVLSVSPKEKATLEQLDAVFAHAAGKAETAARNETKFADESAT